MADHELLRGDLEWGTTPKLVVAQAARLGDELAIVDGQVAITFADLAGRVEAMARAVIAAGLEPGERAAIWAPNLWEWAVVALGVHSAGGVVVPINTRFKGHEAGYVLEKSGARLLFTLTGFLDTDYVDLLRSAVGGAAADRPVAGLPLLNEIVVLRGERPAGTVDLETFLERGGSVPAEQAHERAAAVTPDDLSDILFTSGTTGRPKGVMTAHGQNLRAFSVWAGVVGLQRGDRYLVVNPFFHTFGYKAGILAALMTGATVHPHLVFDAPSVMARIEAEHITMLPGPPSLYQSILNHPEVDAYDLSSLRLAVTGAAAIPVELIVRMGKELHFESVITGYGLTECCGIATMCRYDDDPETIATTSGRAIPDLEVRCVDVGDVEVPRGEPGEVVVRGYSVMQGYLDDPAETAAAIDQGGWLHTGDIATMDERGYVRITDRTKDMFIVGGFNAYPAEIENLMLANQTIAQVAVIGVPDERMGEVGWAYVVPRTGRHPTEEDLAAWCRDRMANYKVPRRMVMVDELPMNATGKVLKYVLRERAAGD